ncbi:MAG: high light inducible protein [Candidatus Synechococcus spongiarum 15L]|uniref:High light inducible protein n=3 Tax=Candidatus Synechococcus spongiarum TaxID=431041 RepID=A0A1T1D3K0_9SYNE|nr:chlorophyll a/b-binding protein [Candidatus Synechococcus spongiarum]KKZ10023.1 MAG: high light inducible protein [Candidatus Synechococcus spongiarum 15L]MCY4359345.1 chlorophyll a/b-binding protein [Cyanobacteria bacterium MAG APA_bin_95]OOV34169.1 high light inducible protein [Candidatus Synechococcus spongiarum LMB bulk15N]OOV35380.1 high light inducible protein [Candidatus Synechococcus spongiarum LMB bulk15M]
MTDSASTDPGSAAAEASSPPTSSATTNEAPSFGWSSYAERINGRFAMVGILVVVAIELCTGSTVIRWLNPG